jgi:DNA-binding SARP family transcriptional activator
MTPLPPYIFSLLNVPLLAAMIVYIMVRQPRQPLTWAFAGTMAGLAVFFFAHVAAYQSGISERAITVWQFVVNQGATMAILAATALNYVLRDGRLKTWEITIVGVIVAQSCIDTLWLAGQHLPTTPYGCLGPRGFGHPPCLFAEPQALALRVLAEVLLVVLFISTTIQVSEPKRSILRRYLVWIVLLLIGSSVLWQVLLLADGAVPDILPIAPTTLIAITIALRLFLALEEAETGMRIPAVGWRVLLWFVLLLVAVLIDLTWGIPSGPVWTLLIVAVGIAAGGAMLVNSLARSAASSKVMAESASLEPAPLVEPSLRLYLLGPMRVVLQGETLPNTTNVWRSAKTRSLLAWLALRREAGTTQAELVDALWPAGLEFDAAAERSNLSALRSYLSTLRRVLDPAGPRGSDRFIWHEGERYILRSDEVWVDVWEFEALTGEAEALLRQGRQAEGLACWQQAVALYAPSGLLPDESYLPASLIEPARESLRQRWLAGLRYLARAEEIPTSATALWETIHQAEPLDQEATLWLVESYRRLGNVNGLRVILQRRRDAEAEMGLL